MNVGEWWYDTDQASCEGTLDATNTFRWPCLCSKCLQ